MLDSLNHFTYAFASSPTKALASSFNETVAEEMKNTVKKNSVDSNKITSEIIKNKEILEVISDAEANKFINTYISKVAAISTETNRIFTNGKQIYNYGKAIPNKIRKDLKPMGVILRLPFIIKKINKAMTEADSSFTNIQNIANKTSELTQITASILETINIDKREILLISNYNTNSGIIGKISEGVNRIKNKVSETNDFLNQTQLYIYGVKAFPAEISGLAIDSALKKINAKNLPLDSLKQLALKNKNISDSLAFSESLISFDSLKNNIQNYEKFISDASQDIIRVKNEIRTSKTEVIKELTKENKVELIPAALIEISKILKDFINIREEISSARMKINEIKQEAGLLP